MSKFGVQPNWTMKYMGYPLPAQHSLDWVTPMGTQPIDNPNFILDVLETILECLSLNSWSPMTWQNLFSRTTNSKVLRLACGRVARGEFVGPKGRGFDPPSQIYPSVWPGNWVSNSHSNKWAASRRGVSPLGLRSLQG
ncbi:hypothetical protein YC2023_010372 [Brassica napus]